MTVSHPCPHQFLELLVELLGKEGEGQFPIPAPHQFLELLHQSCVPNRAGTAGLHVMQCAATQLKLSPSLKHQKAYLTVVVVEAEFICSRR